MDIKKIKMIIWDLDETLWEGTLSEGEVCLSERNRKFIYDAADYGIISSICSKNDREAVETELHKEKIWEYFVFPSIDWTPKGARIQDQLSRMRLRPENVLFLDDNPSNRKEAELTVPGLVTRSADDLPSIIKSFGNFEGFRADFEHKRLEQYHLLEMKTREEAKVGSNETFLRQSKIRVCMEDGNTDIDRIEELIQRSNQLNYTKLRSSKEEILLDWNSGKYQCGSIYVCDKYGDYGLVGYYQIEKDTRNAKHFLFSCRILGMGVEQFVYEKLGYPSMMVSGTVANNLKWGGKLVDWISLMSKGEYEKYLSRENGEREEIAETRGRMKKGTILLKGPCDLQMIRPFLSGVDIDTEFNFVNESGWTVAGHTHTVHMVQSMLMSDSEIDGIVRDVPFVDRRDFETRLFSGDYGVIFLSLLSNVQQGIYRNKEKGYQIAFCSSNYSLTDPKLWDSKFISGRYENTFPFTKEILQKFSAAFEFEGSYPPERTVEDVRWIRENLPEETLLVLLGGSEIESDINTEEFANLAPRYRAMNEQIQETFGTNDRIRIINPTKYITEQGCFNGCTNHFSKQVYYKMAQEISQVISEEMDERRVRVLRDGSLAYLFGKVKRRLVHYKRGARK